MAGTDPYEVPQNDAAYSETQGDAPHRRHDRVRLPILIRTVRWSSVRLLDFEDVPLAGDSFEHVRSESVNRCGEPMGLVGRAASPR